MNRWTYHEANLTLTLNDPPLFYEIDLERCNTSAEALDWIVQVSKKTWATDEILADLVRMLDRCLHLQQNTCSGGVDHKFNAASWLRSKEGRADYALGSEEFSRHLDRYRDEHGVVTCGDILRAEKEFLQGRI
jgi:hypothetical protein